MTLFAQFDISGRRHVEYGDEPHGGLLHGQWVHEHTIAKVFVDLWYVAGNVPLPQKRPAVTDSQNPAAAGEGNREAEGENGRDWAEEAQSADSEWNE